MDVSGFGRLEVETREWKSTRADGWVGKAGGLEVLERNLGSSTSVLLLSVLSVPSVPRRLGLALAPSVVRVVVIASSARGSGNWNNKRKATCIVSPCAKCSQKGFVGWSFKVFHQSVAMAFGDGKFILSDLIKLAYCPLFMM